MKGLRFLLLGLAVCLASGVKAQFYDSADDIYYYVTYKNGEYTNGCLVFNFDGKKGCVLNEYINDEGNVVSYTVDKIKNLIRERPTYFEEQTEILEYKLQYSSNNTYTSTSIYKDNYYDNVLHIQRSEIYNEIYSYRFSNDRKTLYYTCKERDNKVGTTERTYKLVDKSFFKVGRSRTPSGTLHE